MVNTSRNQLLTRATLRRLPNPIIQISIVQIMLTIEKISCLRIILAHKSSKRGYNLLKTKNSNKNATAPKRLAISVLTEPGVSAAPEATRRRLLALIIKLSLLHLLLLSKNRNKSNHSSIIKNSGISNHSINNNSHPLDQNFQWSIYWWRWLFSRAFLPTTKTFSKAKSLSWCFSNYLQTL